MQNLGEHAFGSTGAGPDLCREAFQPIIFTANPGEEDLAGTESCTAHTRGTNDLSCEAM